MHRYRFTIVCTSRRFIPQDNSGTIAKEPPRLEDIMSSMNCVPSIIEENSSKSETNVVLKPRITRRTTSLYTSVKRMKSTKKSRQAVNRKCLKNQRNSNVENGPMISTIRSCHHGVKGTLLKPIGYQLSVDSHIQNTATAIVPTLLRAKRPGKKTTIKLPIEQNVGNEQTTAIKQGPKRLKIVSPKIIKTKPEIGESSKVTSTENSIPVPGVLRFRNKQTAKGVFGRCRKSCLKSDSKAKPRKVSKVKAKS